MRAHIIVVALLTGLACGSASAQMNKAKLDSLFTLLAEKNKAMGSVTISKQGKILYRRVIGYSLISDSEKKAASDLTKYRIGSITKMFTASMIFQLVEEGKIALSTTLDTYFPGIPNAHQITIGNLLHHRSGIHNFTGDPDYATWMTRPKKEDEMIAIISRPKPDFEPNEKTSYSNSNFVILGYIIEKITQRSYAENLTDRITSKIGLANTYYGKKTDATSNESYSYLFDGSWKQAPETDMSIPGGAGAIVSTPTDLTKFIESLFSQKLVSQRSLDQMMTIIDGLGMGILQFPFGTKRAYGHNGGIDGFASNVAYFPQDSVAVAYCTNGMAYPINDIMIGILSAYFNTQYSLPTFDAIVLPIADLDKFLGVYSSLQLPLKITITKNSKGLVAQATGQSSFPLEAVSKTTFKYDQAGIIMEFIPDSSVMTLRQGGGTYLFTRTN